MKKLFVVIFILAAGIATTFYLIKTKPQKANKPSQQQVWTVASQTVQLQTLTPQLRLYARVESPSYAHLSTGLTANVQQILVKEGQQVNKGQLLLVLDDAEIQIKIQQYNANLAEIAANIALENNQHQHNKTALTQEKNLLALAEQAQKRAQNLYQQKIGSEAELDKTRQNTETYRLTVNKRQLDLNNHEQRLKQLTANQQQIIALQKLAKLDAMRCQLSAPFTGMVTEINTAVGERVNVSAVLISLYDNQHLELRAQVPDRYVVAFNPHLNIHADVAVKFSRLAGSVQAQKGGLDVLFQLIEAKTPLRLGQFVPLVVDLPAIKNAVAVPYDALYGKNTVYKLVAEAGNGQQLARLTVNIIGERFLGSQKHLLIQSAQLYQNDVLLTTQLPNAINGLIVKSVKD